jgi:hypothetical protein
MKTETRSVFAKNFPTFDDTQKLLSPKTSVLIQTRLRALFRPNNLSVVTKRFLDHPLVVSVVTDLTFTK